MCAGDPQRLWFLNTYVVIKAPPDGADGICVIEHLAGQGDSPPLHVHRDQDEVFVLLAGEVRFRVVDQDIAARAGDCLLAPKGSPHTYLVTSSEPARWLTITRGDGFISFVRQIGRPAATEGLPERVGPPSAAEQEALTRIAEKHGIKFVGPPLH